MRALDEGVARQHLLADRIGKGNATSTAGRALETRNDRAAFALAKVFVGAEGRGRDGRNLGGTALFGGGEVVLLAIELTGEVLHLRRALLLNGGKGLPGAGTTCFERVQAFHNLEELVFQTAALLLEGVDLVLDVDELFAVGDGAAEQALFLRFDACGQIFDLSFAAALCLLMLSDAGFDMLKLAAGVLEGFAASEAIVDRRDRGSECGDLVINVLQCGDIKDYAHS